MIYSYITRLTFDLLFFTTFIVLFTFYPLRLYKNYNKTGTVHIKNEGASFQLYRNGQPFYIKGAGGISHFEELANTGGNTIRVYDTLNLAEVLDEAEKNGLAVIVDIPLPKYIEQFPAYDDKKKNDERKAKVKELVQKFRDHPALLIWNLGNELNYPPEIFPNNFIDTFNELIEIIHTEDPDHLVSTTVIEIKKIIAITLHSPKLDLLGYNIFGKIKNIRSNVFLNSVLPISFPYYISEWGSDGHWETSTTNWGAKIEPTSTKKIEQLRDRYVNHILKTGDNCLGSLVFYWGQQYECTYTWFNLFTENGKKSEMVSTLNNLWKGLDNENHDIGLEYMLVDGLGAPSSIILSPNALTKAELKLKKIHNDSLRISWELYPDYCNWKEPEKIANAIVSKNGLTVIFETPKEEGPYRIYAYLEDQDGYVAICNTPFYVLGVSDER